MKTRWLAVALLAALAGCGREDQAPPAPPAPAATAQPAAAPAPAAPSYAEQHLAQLETVRLTADLSGFDDDDRKLLRLLTSSLIAAAHGAVALPLGTPSMKSPPIISMARLLVEATLHSWDTRLRAARHEPEWPHVSQELFFRKV